MKTLSYKLIVNRFAGSLLCLSLLSGCAFVNAAGRAYEGAGQGLKTAAMETKQGTVPHRVINFFGNMNEAVGGALRKSVREDRAITANYPNAKMKGKKWDR
jgi:hypothetical protein